MGDAASRRIAEDPGHDAPLVARIDALNKYLFTELGFAGNRNRYDDPRNSCLNEVLDRRTGYRCAAEMMPPWKLPRSIFSSGAWGLSSASRRP